MCEKYFQNRKASNVVIIVGILFIQLHFPVTSIEARKYKQPYGDIMPGEDENNFENDFEAESRGNRFGNRNEYRQNMPQGRRYQNEFAAPALGDLRRNERQKYPYQDIGNHNNQRNNNNLMRTNSIGWKGSSRIEDMQHDNITEQESMGDKRHICNIWVPEDVLDKYPDAERKQHNRNAGSVFIEICCKGYTAMRWRGKTICRPVCDNCQNGRCIAPGICKCYEEYVANDNGDCVFTCPIGCLNGRCYLDGSCQCDPGYKLDESRKFCRPICSKGCGTNNLHNCTEPEVCGCVKGYILTDNDCQPVCQHDCGTGGICRQPDDCQCNPGFDLKDGVCQADCYQKCDNGICFSRNRCICSPGFTYHEGSTQCVPK